LVCFTVLEIENLIVYAEMNVVALRNRKCCNAFAEESGARLCGPPNASEDKLQRAPPWRNKLTTKKAANVICGWSKRIFTLPKRMNSLWVS
jgi:hypothetical protein